MQKHKEDRHTFRNVGRNTWMIKSKEREIGQRYDRQKTQTCQKEWRLRRSKLNTTEEYRRNNKKSRNSIPVPKLRQKCIK